MDDVYVSVELSLELTPKLSQELSLKLPLELSLKLSKVLELEFPLKLSVELSQRFLTFAYVAT